MKDGSEMISQCAWCKKKIKDHLDGGPKTHTVISHGICADCADKMSLQTGQDLSAFLDGIAAPIVVVDEDAVVKSANREAQKGLKKGLLRMAGCRVGTVFECAHSTLPGGCGRTIHCNGCSIRRAIAKTLKTGKPLSKIPSYLNRREDESVKKVRFLISTQKVGRLIFLKIEDLPED
jgi:hypothetical protein